MSYQSQLSPVRTTRVPLTGALRLVLAWLKRAPRPQTRAPMSERLRRDAGLPSAHDETAEHRAMQTYRDRHMTLL